MASKVRSIQRARDQQKAKEATIDASLGNLMQSADALQRLMTQVLPAAQAFALGKVAKSVRTELDGVNETRLKLCQQYGTLNEDETLYVFEEKDKRELFEKEWNDLMAVQVTIKGQTIPAEKLAHISISAADLLLLSWLIVE